MGVVRHEPSFRHTSVWDNSGLDYSGDRARGELCIVRRRPGARRVVAAFKSDVTLWIVPALGRRCVLPSSGVPKLSKMTNPAIEPRLLPRMDDAADGEEESD